MIKRSIKIQMIAVFIWIMTFTMVLCWALNNFFLKSFYMRDMQKTFRDYYQAVSADLQGNDMESVGSQLVRMRYEDNISFIQITPEFVFVSSWGNYVSETEREEMKQRLLANLYALRENDVPSAERNSEPNDARVLESTEKYIIQEKNYLVSNTSYMECYGKFDNNSFFMMSTPMTGMRDSIKISNTFLMITCLIAMLLAIILISFITQGITNPILQLAELSRRMASLDFSSRYEGDQENEVAILGNSMNQMADQLKQTIEELQQANDQLKKDIEEKIQIDEIRKEFLSNVSHELKTPIALIQGYAEGLQEMVNEDPESMNFYCEVIIDEADKMNVMVKKLLTLNHLEFGQDALAPEVFNLSEMLDTIIASSELMGQKQGITFVRKYDPVCLVYADEFKMEEVCTNYLSNAMHHASGERKISVYVEDAGGAVRVTVHNTGAQIPQEDLEKVWIKFFKVDKARTREYGGSGIGLSIVKAIMEAHEQPYGVYNTEDGVAFWCCITKAKEAIE